MQDIVMAEIEARLALDQWELMQNPEWHNTGSVGAIHPDDLTPPTTAKYDFQQSRFTFRAVTNAGPTTIAYWSTEVAQEGGAYAWAYPVVEDAIQAVVTYLKNGRE
jgi:hypothetical protein